MPRPIPTFATEEEEQDFWTDHDSADFIDWSQGQRAVFPSLKPTTRSISIRLPESLLSHLKALANKRDVPYQSLLKIYLMERVQEELRREGSAGG